MDAAAQSTVRQQVGGMLAQYRVVALGFAVLDVRRAEVARQMAGADDFDTVAKDQAADGGVVEVIAVQAGDFPLELVLAVFSAVKDVLERLRRHGYLDVTRHGCQAVLLSAAESASQPWPQSWLSGVGYHGR